MSGAIIVLGWDGLNLELAERFGVAESFGAHTATIETYVNPATDEPHTKELWPSMITGLHPDEHGISVTVDGESRPDWESGALTAAARVADWTLPDSIQAWAGRRLQRQGAAQACRRPRYYRDRDVTTVFDAVGGRAVSIPNYQTERDRHLGLDANRDAVWAALDVDRGGTEFVPRVALGTVHDILGRELGHRVGQTVYHIGDGQPLVWCWFGLLDTVGHIAPAVDAGLERQYYEIAAAQTRAVRALAPDDATVVAVSDHGIQKGEHTQHATIASDDRPPVAAIDHVFELADWIRRQSPTGDGGAAAVDAQELQTVNERLESLGYVG